MLISIESIIGALIGGGIIGFIGGLIALWANRGKLKAETAKLVQDIIGEMQEQINSLRLKADVLYEEREKLRGDRDKLRDELNRVHVNIEVLQQSLATETARNYQLTTLVTEMSKTALERGTKITQLEASLASFTTDLNVVKKKTGELSESMIPDHSKDKP